MPRRKRVLKRPVLNPDPTYNSLLVTKLINRIMWNGKKTVATKIVYSALEIASKELQISPIEVLETAVNNTRPTIEVKAVRVGGATYQVPIEPYAERSLRLGLTWITNTARNQKGKAMSEKLATALIDSYNNTGQAVSKRNAVHQTAAGNRAFAHLAIRVNRKK